MRIELDADVIGQRAERISNSVGDMVVKVRRHDSGDLADWMEDSFWWRTAAALYPDMTADEIASMAADGFEVPDRKPARRRAARKVRP